MTAHREAAEGSLRVPVLTPVLLVILVGISSLGPMSTQILLPALPALRETFEATLAQSQAALSLSFFAFGLAMPFYGPLSDRYGRRPVLILGLTLYLLAVVGAWLAPTIDSFLVTRLLQGFGSAVGMVLARAIIADVMGRDRAVSAMAYLALAQAVVPMLSPALGSYIVEWSGWRTIFPVVFAVSFVLFVVVLLALPETNHNRTTSVGLRALVDSHAKLFRHRVFWAYGMQSAFSIAVFFIFITNAPYILVEIMGRPITDYGKFVILLSLSFMLGNYMAARVSARVGTDRMVLVGNVLLVVSGGLALLVLHGLGWTPWALFLPHMLMAFGNGLSIPNATTAAVMVDRSLAGTASGAAGFVQMMVGSAMIQASGALPQGSPYPMVLMMLGCSAVALVSFLILRYGGVRR